MTTDELADRLEARGLATVLRRGATTALTGGAVDAEAQKGDLAWMSDAGYARDPARLPGFGGSFLVLPPSARTAPALPDATVVVADNAKLAFTQAVRLALPHILSSGWHASLLIHPDAQVHESATLAPGVVLGAGVEIGADVQVGPNTCIANTTVESGATVGANCAIGLAGFGFAKAGDQQVLFPHIGRVLICRGASIGSNTCIDRASLGETVIGEGARIDNLVHVAHNVVVGANSLVIANAMLGGSATIGDRAWIAPSASILNQASVGADATVGMGAVVIRDVEPGQTVVGNPAKPLAPRP